MKQNSNSKDDLGCSWRGMYSLMRVPFPVPVEAPVALFKQRRLD